MALQPTIRLLGTFTQHQKPPADARVGGGYFAMHVAMLVCMVGWDGRMGGWITGSLS